MAITTIPINLDPYILSRNMFYAARMCYNKGVSIAECLEYTNTRATSEEINALLLKCTRAGHTSILEHCIISFAIEGISRNCTHQIVRHRHMSFAQQSFHYTKTSDVKIVPILIDKKNKTTTIKIQNEAQKIANRTLALYEAMIKDGVPQEEARHVLPGGMETKIVVSASLRQWIQFCNIRSCVVNCYEIREVALQITTVLLQAFPWLNGCIGPNCKIGLPCKEGAKSCNPTFLLEAKK